MFDFSVDAAPIVADQIDRYKKTNGLFRVLQLGYSRHLPIAIRPDDVLNTIGCIWAKYIVLNAERLRSFFVDHEGKKVLEYKSGGTYSRERLPEFMAGLTALIKDDQRNDNLLWLELAASTTTVADRLVRSAAMLASQKEYYKYRVSLACGFPSVALLGTAEDWDALEFAVQSMPAPDDGIVKWQARLLRTIAGMRSGDEAFWQRCVTNQAFGSGPRDYDGWIVDFNPFNEKGRWMSRMEDDDILDLTVDFDIQVDDNGRQFTVSVEAGPTMLIADDGVLVTRNVFAAQELGQPALVLG
jgi:hypothetical protein